MRNLLGLQALEQFHHARQRLGAFGGAGFQRRQQRGVVRIAQAAVLLRHRQGAGTVVDQTAGKTEEQGGELGGRHGGSFSDAFGAG